MKEKLEFRIASEDWEFEKINDLNYRTFVEEIPQHGENEKRSLEDRFHDENDYIVCFHGRELRGMMAVRDKRPFSLDGKLENLDGYLPEHGCPCEFRLLSIEKEHRNLRIIQGLMAVLAEYADRKGYDIALISANVNRLRLYRQIGFKAFGPEVGTDGARYQPMYLTLASSNEFRRRSRLLRRMPGNFSIEGQSPVNLLPGPVDISGEVKSAMTEPPVSHRSEEFMDDFRSVRRRLCELTGAEGVEIMMGSGSLANDAVAVQLSVEQGKGLILSNGEFGDRLIDHAERAGLEFDSVQLDWGSAFDPSRIEAELGERPETKWLWAVHCETSTGILNDLGMLKSICRAAGIKLCLDCVSSIGTVPLVLDDIYLATGVSGKGIASYSGLSFVFYNHEVSTAAGGVPRYLDIGLYADCGGIPFTMSSNLVYALGKALARFKDQRLYALLREKHSWLRSELESAGYDIVAPAGEGSPALLTIRLPDNLSSERLGLELEDSGFRLHWRSGYLRERNWIQIALMGECSDDALTSLIKTLSGKDPTLSRAI